MFILGEDPKELVALSPTRWAMQVKSIRSVSKNYKVLIKTLPELETVTAPGLLKWLQKPTTIYLMLMLQKLLGTTETLHVYLQKHDLDLSKALIYKDAVLKTLKDMRSPSTSDILMTDTHELMKASNITSTAPRRNKRKKMDDYYKTETTGRREEASDSDSFRRSLFYPTLDRMISELESRFSEESEEVLRGVDACNPSSEYFLDLKHLHGFAEFYKIELRDEEVAVVKTFINALQKKEDRKFTMEELYGRLDALMFPTLHELIQIALTIPVTSCCCERSFSTLRRLKIWLRNRCSNERLDDLAVLSIEKDTYTQCTDCELIAAFDQMHTRRH